MYKILIVEDDKNLNKGLSIALRDDYYVFSSNTCEKAKPYLSEADLILLDMNLPDIDGLDLIKEIRTKLYTPIIVISAVDLESYIISAINLGADDYIIKPFSLAILQAKIKRILNKKVLNNKIYSEKEFYFNFSENIFKIGNINETFTPTEEKILYYLVNYNGKILTKEILIEKVWGIDEIYVDDNTLNVNISRLRSKLKPHEPIKTVFGVGYKWEY